MLLLNKKGGGKSLKVSFRVLGDVSEELESNHGGHGQGGQEGRGKDNRTGNATLDVSRLVTIEIDNAADTPDGSGDGSVGGVTQASNGHKPKLGIMGLEQVLVTTLDGVESGLGIIVHVGVLHA